MPRLLRPAVLALLLALPCAPVYPQPPGGEPSALPANPIPGPDLVRELRKGGHVLYIRHTSTDFGQNDENMTSFEDCATQRNLTDKGREEARAIAAAIKRLGVPIGSVRAGLARAGDETRYAPLRKLLSTKFDEGTNLVISSHGNPFRAVAGPPHLEEGELAVIQPLGDDKFGILARLRVSDWRTLPDR